MNTKKFIQESGQAMLAVVVASLFILVCLLCVSMLLGAVIGLWRGLR